jgi:hypothetical protein
MTCMWKRKKYRSELHFETQASPGISSHILQPNWTLWANMSAHGMVWWMPGQAPWGVHPGLSLLFKAQIWPPSAHVLTKHSLTEEHTPAIDTRYQRRTESVNYVMFFVSMYQCLLTLSTFIIVMRGKICRFKNWHIFITVDISFFTDIYLTLYMFM